MDSENTNTKTHFLRYPNMDSEQFKTDTFLTKMKKFFMGNEKNENRRRCNSASRHYCVITCLTIIFACSCTGCIIMWFTDIYLSSILEQMTIKEGSEIFKEWRSPPVKPLICVRVFNYTNVERFASGQDEKLKLDEVGPYCYRETLLKTNITFDKNGTVTYGDRRMHKFEPLNSTGKLDDLLIVPNIPLISAVSRTKDIIKYIRIFTNAVLRAHGTTLVRVKAHEFFFGYNDDLFEKYSGLAKFLDQDVPIEKFGMLAMRAAETKDRITVTTGTNDLDQIGIVTGLNGRSKMTAWSNDSCNRIDGSDGAFFPRHLINTSNTLYLFHKDLCRKLPLIYQQEVDFQDGVMAMRFHVPPDVYNTEGTCYCKDTCPPKGVFDVSPCAQGAPLLTSFPHFMNADPSLTKNIEGLHPDSKKHDFYIDIQPILGFTLGTVSRLQINIQIQKAEEDIILEEFENNMILPVLWLEVTADRLPEKLFKLIYHASFTVEVVQHCLKWITLIATVISGIGLVYCVWRKPKHNFEKETNNGGSSQSQKIIIMRLTTV